MAKISGSEESGSAVKVGALADVTGLTVRTLHYYDEIGLLSPSARTDAGHRLYSTEDVKRLYRIVTLRQLGFGLDEISASVDDTRCDLLVTINQHLGRIDHRLGVEQRLRNRLAAISDALARESHDVDIQQFLNVLEDMTMLGTNIQRRIPTIVYSDISAAHEFLTTVFGFEPGRVAEAPDGTVFHAEVTAGDGVIWLHQESERFGLRSPQSLGATTEQMSIVVEDVDAHYQHAEQHGAEIVYPPTDQPYGYREYGARDIEQRLWSFLTPLS